MVFFMSVVYVVMNFEGIKKNKKEIKKWKLNKYRKRGLNNEINFKF